MGAGNEGAAVGRLLGIPSWVMLKVSAGRQSVKVSLGTVTVGKGGSSVLLPESGTSVVVALTIPKRVLADAGKGAMLNDPDTQSSLTIDQTLSFT